MKISNPAGPTEPKMAVKRLDERKLPTPTPRPCDARTASIPCFAQSPLSVPDLDALLRTVMSAMVLEKSAASEGLRIITPSPPIRPSTVTATITTARSKDRELGKTRALRANTTM